MRSEEEGEVTTQNNMDLTRHPASHTTRTYTAVVATDRLRPHPFHQTNSQIAEAQTPPTFPRVSRTQQDGDTHDSDRRHRDYTGCLQLAGGHRPLGTLDPRRDDDVDDDTTPRPFTSLRRRHLDPSPRRFTTPRPVSLFVDIHRQSASVFRRHSAGRHHRTRRRGGRLHHSARPHLRRR